MSGEILMGLLDTLNKGVPAGTTSLNVADARLTIIEGVLKDVIGQMIWMTRQGQPGQGQPHLSGQDMSGTQQPSQ